MDGCRIVGWMTDGRTDEWTERRTDDGWKDRQINGWLIKRSHFNANEISFIPGFQFLKFTELSGNFFLSISI